ncbi:hypothetical protein DEO72_LG4g1272 [Vigna unguiculata]|uniref:Uncharacterized protein n=1 Tax=Vigna unguiculata TaxID=3917 RepID=A0A4D6LP44_VIGUN|nr:hypothetical protein DEO72_LG4g1272 [Vigna unguiculata]
MIILGLNYVYMFGACFSIIWHELECGLVLVVVNWVREQRLILQVSPKRAISPKREVQNLVSVLGSRCLLRRPVLELSDRDSRLGESGSPKRGHDGNLHNFEHDFSSR